MRWQPIPPAAPASLTIFLDPRPFHPSNGNPEAHQYHINHIQCLWHSISANDAAMAAELPLLRAAISPSALPASPLTRCMNTDAIKNRMCGNCRLWFHPSIDVFTVGVGRRAAEIWSVCQVTKMARHSFSDFSSQHKNRRILPHHGRRNRLI